MPTREQLERGEEAVQRFRERVGPRINVLWVLPDYYEDLPKPCMGGWGRTHDPRRAERRGAALPRGVDDPRPRVPERARALARLDLERVGRVLAGSAAPTGCRSRAGRARSGARRRTSAAAAARRCGSPATPRPPIPCAGSRRTTTTVVAAREPPRRTSSRTGRRGAAGVCVVASGGRHRGRSARPAATQLDEHAHAVAARPGADRVAAVVVEQRGPEHVDVRPRPLAGEALEERRGDDRIAVRPAPSVLRRSATRDSSSRR